jgi:hypothetical protein
MYDLDAGDLREKLAQQAQKFKDIGLTLGEFQRYNRRVAILAKLLKVDRQVIINTANEDAEELDWACDY